MQYIHDNATNNLNAIGFTCINLKDKQTTYFLNQRQVCNFVAP